MQLFFQVSQKQKLFWLPGILIAAFNQVKEADLANQQQQQQSLEDYGKSRCHLTAQLGTWGGRSLGGGKKAPNKSHGKIGFYICKDKGH